jgi:hypothetical protein
LELTSKHVSSRFRSALNAMISSWAAKLISVVLADLAEAEFVPAFGGDREFHSTRCRVASSRQVGRFRKRAGLDVHCPIEASGPVHRSEQVRELACVKWHTAVGSYPRGAKY